MPRNLIKLHQALHGYDAGHKLLACSMELQRKAQRTLAALSDLSGTSTISGFESYLTGYPLRDAEVYALSRTWYATEQPRPGCVWSHTLLLGFDLLATITDFRFIEALFRRPEAAAGLRGYAVPLEVREEPADPTQMRPSKSLVAELADALYWHEGRPVIVSAAASVDFELAALAIWSQQWPALRKAFTFCTGSLSGRALAGKAFQFQVVPRSSVGVVRRSLDDPVVVDTSAGDAHMSTSRSLCRVAEDLVGSHSRPWRKRLAQIGGHLPGERRWFPLAAVLADWTHVGDERSLVEYLVRGVEDREIDVQCLSCLAELCFGRQRITIFSMERVRLLEELSIIPRLPSLDAWGAWIKERIGDLSACCEDETSGLLLKLLKRELNPLGEQVLEGIASAIAAKPSSEILVKLRDALPILASLNPEIATRSEIWEGPCRNCYEVLEAVAEHGDSTGSFRHRVVGAMLDARQDRLAQQLLARFGDDVVTSVLEWFNASDMVDPNALPQGWRGLLAGTVGRTLLWLEEFSGSMRASTVALMSTYVRPDHRIASNMAIGKLVSAFHGNVDDTPPLIYDQASAFVLAVGMASSKPEGKELVLATYDRVHQALMADRLSEDAWAWVSWYVPRLGIFRDWDHAERLRRGLIELFSGRRWPTAELASAARSLESWRYLVRSCGKTKKGKRLLRGLLDSSRTGTAALSEDKMAVVRGTCR
ncbi:hypothetical protein LCGC14_0993170 [marine sediment metagenome]|uniref:Uncharacterized protein n=1 Tax=marine sediment metagenome TaxID=412755 RepID=A0A0F9N577_9ZZZZ